MTGIWSSEARKEVAIEVGLKMNLTDEVLHLMSPLPQDEGAAKVETLVLPDVLQPASLVKNMGSRRGTMRTINCKTRTTRVRLYKITD